MEVANASRLSAQIFLCARVTEQEAMTPRDRELIELLLTRYAYISIRDKEGEIYRGPVEGNLSPQEGDMTMASPICLGSFYPGRTKHYLISLAVSPEMDMEYRSLLGKVRWEFSASGGSGEYPYTGDETDIWIYLGLMSIGLGLMALVVYRRASRKGGEK